METEFRPTRVVEIETKWSKQSEARRAACYLVLPPLKEMAAPAKLPGKALALLLLIHHRQRIWCGDGRCELTVPAGGDCPPRIVLPETRHFN
jgi:hypothetical protein